MKRKIKEPRRYGQWSGCPSGYAENTERCIAEVASGWVFAQCSRKRGHGPDGLHCKQHAKRFEKASET